MLQKIVSFFFKSHSIVSGEFLLIAGVIVGLFFDSAYKWGLSEGHIAVITTLVGTFLGLRQGAKSNVVNGNGGGK